MQIEINLSEEQIKALLTVYVSIEEYCQRVVENRANRLCEQIVKDYADNLEGVTVDEQAVITSGLAGKIIVKAEKLPKEVKQIIVRRSKVKSMIEKITEQELLEKPIVEPIKEK